MTDRWLALARPAARHPPCLDDAGRKRGPTRTLPALDAGQRWDEPQPRCRHSHANLTQAARERHGHRSRGHFLFFFFYFILFFNRPAKWQEMGNDRAGRNEMKLAVGQKRIVQADRRVTSRWFVLCIS